jgi:hypothetical protein
MHRLVTTVGQVGMGSCLHAVRAELVRLLLLYACIGEPAKG